MSHERSKALLLPPDVAAMFRSHGVQLFLGRAF